MNWILDNFQIVLLVALAFASWLKTRHDNKKAEEEQDHLPDPTVWEDEEEDDWNPPAMPPPLPREQEGYARPQEMRMDPPPVPVPVQQMVEREEMTELLERQKEIEEEFRRIRQAKPAPPMPTLKKRENREPWGQEEVRQGPFAKALRNRSAVRKAVVLREILGPPVGMR